MTLKDMSCVPVLKPVRIPVVIKGIDKHGYEFEEGQKPLSSVSMEHAFSRSTNWKRIRSYRCGSNPQRTLVRFSDCVDWNGERQLDQYIGIEFIQTTDFFGGYFPG